MTSNPLHDACEVCGAQPGDWCEPWCSEQPDPALRVPDKDEQIAALTSQRDQLRAALKEACEHMHHPKWCGWNEWASDRSECNCGNETRRAALAALAERDE